MKKSILFIILALTMQTVRAETTTANDDQEIQAWKRHLRVKKALLSLLDEGALTLPDNQCPQFEPGLLEELRNNGTVRPGHGVRPSTICVIPN